MIIPHWIPHLCKRVYTLIQDGSEDGLLLVLLEGWYNEHGQTIINLYECCLWILQNIRSITVEFLLMYSPVWVTHLTLFWCVNVCWQLVYLWVLNSVHAKIEQCMLWKMSLVKIILSFITNILHIFKQPTPLYPFLSRPLTSYIPFS